MNLPNANKVDNLSALTGLRFFAAIWVVLLHFETSAKMPVFPRTFIGRGYVAVDVFYILSGYILTLNYIQLTGAFRGDRKKFWIARFARVYPVYAVALLLSTGMGWEAYRYYHNFSGIPQFVSSFVLTALLQQTWWYKFATLWNYPAWSVSVEAFFYLAFPFAALWVARIPRSHLNRALLLCWCVALIGPALAFLNNPAASYDQRNTDFFRYVFMVNPLLRLPEFIFGMILGRMFQLNTISPRRLSLWATVSLIVAVVVLGTAFVPRIFVASGLLAPAWAILIYALAMGKPAPLHRLLSWPLMVILGEASYGIYILQVPIAWFFFKYYPGPWRLTVYLLVLIVCSVLSFWYFETPIRNYIRVRSGRRPVDVLAPEAGVRNRQADESFVASPNIEPAAMN